MDRAEAQDLGGPNAIECAHGVQVDAFLALEQPAHRGSGRGLTQLVRRRLAARRQALAR